jgi:hypothetical protein
MRSIAPLLITIALASFAAASCDASGHVNGGDPLFDASVPASGEGGVDPDQGLGTGTTFTDLYDDFFGPMSKAFPNAQGQAGCAGIGACHGDPTQPGAIASGGYVCPAPDKDAGAVAGGGDAGDGGTLSIKEICRATMIKSGIVTCGQPFDMSYVKHVIRKINHAPDDENNMPRDPYTYAFSDKGVARFGAWVESGCPDN